MIQDAVESSGQEEKPVETDATVIQFLDDLENDDKNKQDPVKEKSPRELDFKSLIESNESISMHSFVSVELDTSHNRPNDKSNFTN